MIERPELIWVDRMVVEAIHADQITQYGGSHGVRDEGLLESALARPRMRQQYDPGIDLADVAATYCVGLAKNHAFIDGNKRTAFQGMFVFLYVNGLDLQVAEPDAVAIMLEVATSAVTEQGLAAWIRTHTTPR